MYKSHFRLTRNPFDLTPDPVCFVPTERHKEALAALYHGVRRHKGFVVLTGEVGTGKTLLLRCLLDLLKESKDVAYAYMFNGRLSGTEFLQYILSDFGLPAAGKSKYELLLDFGRFLVARGEKKMTTVLIVDEAHLLSADILEEVRLLSNLETTDDRLLQIVLVGQPELDEMLDSVELRQIKQRIAVRTHLIPLDAEETRVYIEKRLQIAGASPTAPPLFSAAAVREVFLHSKGLPRLINTICENALISAFAKRQPCVTAEIIGPVAKELRLNIVHTPAPLKAGGSSDLNIHRTMATLLELLDVLRKSSGSRPRTGATAEMGVTGHEPNI